jgi:hypothetical protein
VGDWYTANSIYPFGAEVWNTDSVGRLTEPAMDPREGDRHVRTDERKENVKAHGDGVRKVSTNGPTDPVPFSFKLTLPPRTALWLTR